MFRPKIIVTVIIFLILLIFTSIIKNKTRVIEKKLYFLNETIVLKEKDINESQLDFYFLSSPSQIEKKIISLGLNNYSVIESSKIFLSLSNFLNIQNKLSMVKIKNEKKKKN
jgi:hypothetical protein